MKKLLIGALMVITSYGAHAQERIIEIPLSNIPTNEEVEMMDEVSGVKVELKVTPSVDTIPQHRVGPPHFGHPAPPMVRMPFLPKPQQIIDKGDKVILIFTKSDWAKYQRIKRWHYQRNKRRLETEIGWQRNPAHNSMQRDYMERNPKGIKH
jgi:hypothetical protein